MRLYEANETKFDHNGFGFLSEATEAQVTEERNGAFELTMKYPSKGALFSELKHRRLIYCPAHPGGTPQPFRIYRITKPMGGLVTVYAEHISYDLSGVMLSRFSAGSAAEAVSKLSQYAVGNNLFTFFTDKSTKAGFQVKVPASIRSKLGGSEGSLLDVYGGEYVFDGFTVKLLNTRGENRGVSIRYGKNLTDLTQEENIQSVYTGVYPYWEKEDDYFELPEKTVNAEGTFGFTRFMPLDMSQDFEQKPSAEQLRAKAQEYMKSNKIGVPKVSLTVGFFPLEQSEEYKDLALLETVYLCDTVNVEFPELGVSATAKVVKTVYDVLQKRYSSIELGDAKSNIADTIVKQGQEIQKKPSYSALEDAINNATNWITNGGGYIMAIKDEAGNWKEIVSLDVNNLEQAKKVWRWNNGGFGFSSTGYNGPYRLAITQDGAIVADFITTGTLTANIIKAGILKSLNGATEINMETGVAKLTGSLRTETRTSEGKTVYSNLDSGGLTIQRNEDQVRGVYTNSSNDVIGNLDQLYITKKESSTSKWGDAMIFAEHDGKDTVIKMYADTAERKLAVSLGKLMKWFADLKAVAFSGSYNDLSNKPTAASLGVFAKTDIIPIANGGTGAKSTNDARKNLGLMCRTVVSTTDANGMVTIPVSEYGSSPVYAMACHTFQGTSLRIGDPIAGKVQVIVFNGTVKKYICAN